MKLYIKMFKTFLYSSKDDVNNKISIPVPFDPA